MKEKITAVLVLLALSIVGLGACDTDTNFTAMPDLPKPSVSNDLASKDASEDVTLGALGLTSYGSAKLDVTVTNHSLKRSNYTVEVVVEKGKQQLDTGMTFTENLEPGQTAVEEVVFFSLDSVPDGAVARVATVERLAALV